MKTKTTTLISVAALMFSSSVAHAELRAGAARIDVTPTKFPVLVNGGMLAHTANQATSRLHARAIALDDGKERLAIVVVDSCMMPRPLLDEAKRTAAAKTKIRADHMLISATHTHTAPASMGCLGTEAEPSYVPYLRDKLVEAIVAAEANLEPAKVGWAVKNAAEYTATRRWIIRPDRIIDDPFGNPTVRANMHAGANWDNVTGEAGPEDPDLSLIAFQALSGRPIAVYANFSMHYFSGVQALNADYFGMFCEGFQAGVGKPEEGRPTFVAAISHGCSGDIWRRDYTKPAPSKEETPTISSYTEGLLEIARAAYREVKYVENADVSAAETRMILNYRVPDKQRLLWARQIVASLGNRPPKTTEEVYAREQIILHERQKTEIVVQAYRIGEIGIATTPNETYALTGLKIKKQSPLKQTMVVELAGGGDGYIPPPEQHLLGGYNTWAARSAGLEVTAEPKIAEAALSLLEQVSRKPRRVYRQSLGPAAEAVLRAKPAAYWRLDEFAPSRALDHSGHDRDGFFEPGVVFFLEGPQSDALCKDGETNRAAHFAGGRLETRVKGLGDRYSVSLWFWNGMPAEGRETSGWMFSRGRDRGLGPIGDHLGVGGTGQAPGKLVYLRGAESRPISGRSLVKRWTWNHVALVRDNDRLRVYLNGDPDPEIDAAVPSDFPADLDRLFFGGRCDNVANWEGRLDEIAVYDRALSSGEVAALSGR